MSWVEVGDALRLAREKAGRTRESVAVLADVSISTVGQLERGVRVKPATVERIARVLGVTVTLPVETTGGETVGGER